VRRLAAASHTSLSNLDALVPYLGNANVFICPSAQDTRLPRNILIHPSAKWQAGAGEAILTEPEPHRDGTRT
jgi:hypothetical protein